MNEPKHIIQSREVAFEYIDTTLRAELDAKLTAAGFDKVGAAQVISETTTTDSHKAWSYFIEGMPMTLDGRTYWLLDTGETVETTMKDGEGTIEEAYQKKYETTPNNIPPTNRTKITKDNSARDDELIATGPLADIQADAPATDGPFLAANSEEAARTKAEALIKKQNPQYMGSFLVSEVPEVGYHVWQDVRGGDSIIVGNDGGVLYFNSSISTADGVQAYKDGKRTPEENFTTPQ